VIFICLSISIRKQLSFLPIELNVIQLSIELKIDKFVLVFFVFRKTFVDLKSREAKELIN
jgi:hypothetical protein